MIDTGTNIFDCLISFFSTGDCHEMIVPNIEFANEYFPFIHVSNIRYKRDLVLVFGIASV